MKSVVIPDAKCYAVDINAGAADESIVKPVKVIRTQVPDAIDSPIAVDVFDIGTRQKGRITAAADTEVRRNVDDQEQGHFDVVQIKPVGSRSLYKISVVYLRAFVAVQNFRLNRKAARNGQFGKKAGVSADLHVIILDIVNVQVGEVESSLNPELWGEGNFVRSFLLLSEGRFDSG